MKLISVNIEGDKHLDKIKNLIEQEQPDIVCMQEVYKSDISFFEQQFSQKALFAPMILKYKENAVPEEWGVAIFSNHKIMFSGEQYYLRNRNDLEDHRKGIYTDLALVVVYVDIGNEENQLRIATTHFCKSADGEADAFQLEQFPKLQQALHDVRPDIFCGDFNAPRGKYIFDELTKEYVDNITPEYTTSIDPDLHRAGDLQFMVDGLFTTQKGLVTDMRFVTGVSDHYAIVAEIDGESGMM